MGQYFLYDAYQGIIENWCDFNYFSATDIDNVFLNRFKHLKFSQEFKILGNVILFEIQSQRVF